MSRKYLGAIRTAGAPASGYFRPSGAIAPHRQTAYIGRWDNHRRSLLETPCINICVLDDQSGLCIGCGRSGDEIAGWVDMTPARRRAIMATLPERLERLEKAEGSRA